MMLPARDLPEEDPSRTGWEGTAGAPAAQPSPDAQKETSAEPAEPDLAGPGPADIGPPPAALAGGSAVDAGAADMWSEIQAMFVDDPRASVAQAADLADGAVEAFITAVRERQAALASSWQVQGTDTERLRAAFQEYRSFWTSVTELSLSP